MDKRLRALTRGIQAKLPVVHPDHWQEGSLPAIAKNFAWLAGDRVLRMGISFLMGAAVARYLGPQEFGVLTFAIAVAELTGVFATLGFESLLSRELLRQPNRAPELLGTGFWSSLVAMILLYGAVIVPIAAFSTSGPDASGSILLAGLVMMRAQLSVLNLQLTVQLQARYGVIAANAAFLLSTGVRLWLIWHGASVTVFAAALAIEPVGTGILLYFFNRNAGNFVSNWRWRWQLTQELLRESWPLLLSGFATLIYMRSDQIMLAYLRDDQEVGRYAAAQRFSEIWYFLPAALASSLLPAIVRSRELGAVAYHRRLQCFYDLNAALAYGLIVVLVPAAPWLFPLVFGKDYSGADVIFQVHIWTCLFVFLGYARNQYLLIEGWTRFLFVCTASGAAGNVALNFLLIPRWGATGAAIATLISQTGVTFLSSFAWGPARAHGWAQVWALLVPFRALARLFRATARTASATPSQPRALP